MLLIPVLKLFKIFYKNQKTLYISELYKVENKYMKHFQLNRWKWKPVLEMCRGWKRREIWI